MCNCCKNSTATLWAVAPASAQSGCGAYTSQTNNVFAGGCGYAAHGASSIGCGCFGGCSRATTPCQSAYSVRQVNGCSNCPYAKTYGCNCCARNWCGN